MHLKLSTAFLFGLLLTRGKLAWAAVPAAELIPAQMAQPAPSGMIKILLLLFFFIHIVLVNIVLGSSILATLNARKAQPDTGLSTGVLALAVNFGVAAFLFAQVAYGSFIYTGIVLMSFWWLAVPLLVMLAYYALYIIKYAGPGWNARRPVFVTANAILLMLTAFLLASHSSLVASPEAWPNWLRSPGGFMLSLGDPTLAPRYLHVIAASLAVSGLFVALRARKNQDDTKVKHGLGIFVYASLAQALVGLWYLFALPAEARAIFLGGSALATGALALALIGLAAALWAARNGMIRLTSGLALSIIFIMVLMRDLARSALLAPYAGHAGGHIALLPLPVPHGQIGAFVLFVFCAGLGAAMILWILRVAIKTFNGTGE